MRDIEVCGGTRRPVRARQLFTLVMGSLAAVSVPAPALATQTGASPASVLRSPHAPIPPDTAVTIDTLPNGLRYYLRVNHAPEHRAELRLVVDAGSAFEDHSQRGLAHFVEHMAFDGTTHFGKQAIQREMEAMGMRFGADLNASTSYDQTIYQLTVPTNQPDAVPTGIRILADWAHGITFDSAAVEAERGIILGEGRTRTSVSDRASERFAALLFHGSPYVDRAPIGLPEIIKTAPRAEIARFYHDWYRPDRMTVIVVGDIDKVAVETLIRTELGVIPKARGGRAAPSLAVPLRTEPVAQITTDSRVKQASVTVVYRRPSLAEHGTPAAVRQYLIDFMTAAMLGERLRDLGRGKLAAEEPVRGVLLYTLDAAARNGGARATLADLLGTVTQVEQHGFTAAELDEVRAVIVNNYEIYDSKSKQGVIPSRTLATDYAHAQLTGGVLLDADAMTTLVRALLGDEPGGITLDDVNAYARGVFTQPGRTIFLAMSSETGAHAPSERALLALADSVAHSATPKYEEQLHSLPLLASLPTPGTVDSARVVPSVGVTEWVLSNGVHVVLKPTTFNLGQLLIRAVAPGGTSLAGDSNYVSAALVSKGMVVSGLGSYSAAALRKRLRFIGPSVQVTPYVGGLDEGVAASASPRDAETLFQMLYLCFTAPRLDTAAVATLEESLKTQLATAQAFYGQVRQRVMTQGNPRGRPLTAAMIDSLDAEQALAFYRARFADASNFTVYIVGAFDPGSMKPLVEHYLGGLPATHAHDSWRDIGLRPPPKRLDVNINGGPANKVTTQLVFTGSMEYNQRTDLLIGGLSQILRQRLMQRLRTELSATYSVAANAAAGQYPYPHYEITIAFDAAPEQAEALTASALTVIDTLATNGPTAQELDDIRALYRQFTQSKQRDNEYWLSKLSSYGWNGYDYDIGIASIEPLLSVLTVDRVQQAAREFLDTTHYVRITIRPGGKNTTS